MNTQAKLQSYFRQKLPLLLSVYLMLQPLLDVLTAFGATAEHSVTAGVVVRTLFMVFAFFYVVGLSRFKGKSICLLFMGAIILYVFCFLCQMFLMGGLSNVFSNIKEVIKVFFAPFVFFFLYAVYREYGYLFTTKAIAITGAIYCGVIFVAFLTNTSLVSYNSGYGFKGWFYAANEVSSIIAITAPITVYYFLQQIGRVTRKTWWVGALIAFSLVSVVFSCNFLGTKIVFGMVLIYSVLGLIWSIVRFLQKNGREMKRRVIVFFVLTVSIVGLYFVSPLQGYLSNIYMPLMDQESEQAIASMGEEVLKAAEGTWLADLIENNDVVFTINWLLSKRLLTAAPSLHEFLNGSLLTKLVGLGYSNVDAYGRNIEFMIEMDPPAIFIRHGVIGFLLYYIPYLASVLYFIVQFFRAPFKRMRSLRYCSYLYSVLVCFAVSTIAGHALVAPAVATFVLASSMQLWDITRAQNRCLPDSSWDDTDFDALPEQS